VPPHSQIRKRLDVEKFRLGASEYWGPLPLSRLIRKKPTWVLERTLTATALVAAAKQSLLTALRKTNAFLSVLPTNLVKTHCRDGDKCYEQDY
jgi:hypothetical protein